MSVQLCRWGPGWVQVYIICYNRKPCNRETVLCHYSIAIMSFNQNPVIYFQLLCTLHLLCICYSLSPSGNKGHLQARGDSNEQACSWRCEKAEPSLPNICPGGVPQSDSAVRAEKRGILILRDALQVNCIVIMLSILCSK